MPVLQPAIPASQLLTHSVTSTSVKPRFTSSPASAAFQYPHSDFTSPVYTEEEAGASDQ